MGGQATGDGQAAGGRQATGRMSTLGRDLALDLGTANTLVYARGQGVVLDEPSVVTVDSRTGAMVAVGAEAKAMIGRTPPYLQATRPLRDGVIADFETTERMVRFFLRSVHRNRHLSKPRVVVAVPSGLTRVEQRAVEEACYLAGARSVRLLEEPLAAAIGAGLPVHEPTGSMVVDIGGGTTEVAIISLGGMVTVHSTRVGGDDLDAAIGAHVKREYSLAIGERTAEQIKISVASAFPAYDALDVDVRGRDLVSGLPRTVTLTSREIRRAIEEPLNAILDTVRAALDECPPELAGDVMDSGITLTGGGALLRGLDERLRNDTSMPVRLAAAPLTCVARGAGACVESLEQAEHVFVAAG